MGLDINEVIKCVLLGLSIVPNTSEKGGDSRSRPGCFQEEGANNTKFKFLCFGGQDNMLPWREIMCFSKVFGKVAKMEAWTKGWGPEKKNPRQKCANRFSPPF